MMRLRRPAVDDVQGIGAVVHKVWGQEILSEVCRAQIEDDASALWVAEEKDDVVGFISAFLTMDGAGRRRWEMDLVAVRPAQQGQGLGRKLIRRAFQDAIGQAPTARALIRTDNLPSQRAFQKAGFTTDGQVHHLLLWGPKRTGEPGACPGEVSLVPVETLTYRGLWIEGLTRVRPVEQRSIVGMARAMVAHEHRLNTGALIPAQDACLVARDLRDQAELHSRYYWFVKQTSAKRKV